MLWWWIPVVSAGTHQWDPAIDTALTAATGITWGALYLGIEDTLPPADTTSAVAPTGLDALALGRWDPGIDRASDLLLYGSIPGALAATSLVGHSEGDALTAPLLVLESWCVTGALTSIIKHAIDRPRPYTFLENPDEEVLRELEEVDSTLSFPSGHTSFMATLAFATAQLAIDTDRLSAGPAYGVAGVSTLAMGSLRVAAGHHYPTDVLAGGALGAATGVIVPSLHRSTDVSVTAAGPVLGLSGTW